jgi:hypothetical protein
MMHRPAAFLLKKGLVMEGGRDVLAPQQATTKISSRSRVKPGVLLAPHFTTLLEEYQPMRRMDTSCG